MFYYCLQVLPLYFFNVFSERVCSDLRGKVAIIWANRGNHVSQSKDQCHSNQTNDCWPLPDQMQGRCPLDQLRSFECLNIWNSLILPLFSLRLCAPYIDVRSKYPPFYPLSHSCMVLLILAVNPALSAALIIQSLISPLSLLTAFQNKDKVVIHLLHPCQQIPPK